MSEEFRVILFNAERAREQFIAAMTHAKSMIENGERVLLTVGPAREPVGIQQRKFLHGVVLPQIAEQVKLPDGSRYTTDVWKAYLKKQLIPKQWKSIRMPGDKRATPRKVEPSTERLGVKAYSLFIDQCIDYATMEWGVQFEYVAEEREAVRYTAAKRKAKESEPA